MVRIFYRRWRGNQHEVSLNLRNHIKITLFYIIEQAYYFNAKSEETTWDKPVKKVAAKPIPVQAAVVAKPKTVTVSTASSKPSVAIASTPSTSAVSSARPNRKQF